MRLAYLVSRYPAPSHTFILREVKALRRLGVGITTFSIRRTPPGELLSDADQAEYRATKALVPPPVLDLVVAHVTAVLSHPVRYFATLLLALRLTRGGLRSLVWQAFYFGEAILLWRWCSQRQIPHIHVHFANVGADVALLASHFGSARTSRHPSLSWSFTAHGPTEFYDISKHRLQEKVENASFVVCISDFCRSQLMAIVNRDQWGKLRVIHCGIDPAVIRRRNRS
jgi:colanic acid/amylovoran biosynthesis glycosyltransferase